MTIKETISQLEDLKSDRESFYNGEDDEIFRIDAQACDNAIAALEKQLQKKPELKAISGFGHEAASQLCCPSCWKSVINYWNRAINPPHCMICGQALDWSDENES